MKPIDSIVYLIEDDDGSRESTECLLGVHQIQTRSFGSAEQFFLEVAEHPVVLTAFGDVPSVVNAFKSGVYDYLEKPFLPHRLINGVSDCLAKSRSGPDA